MPVVFEQPQPLDPITSIRAGAAGVIEKALPSMASMYEAAMRARNSGGGGGGGGHNIGGVQVLPSSDYGALAQVESQANREQRALDIGAEGTIANRLQENRFNLQNQQMDRERSIQAQQDAAVQREGQPQPQQAPAPAPTFSPGDAKMLADAQQDLSSVQEKADNGELGFEEAELGKKAANEKIAGLQAKQYQATEFQKQQAQRERDQAEAHQHGSWMREQGSMQRAAPGTKLPSGEIVVSTFGDGNPSIIKHWDLQHHAWKYEHLKPDPNIRTPADVLQEKKFAHEEKILKDKQSAAALEKADNRMMRFRDQAAKELAPKSLAQDPPTPEQIEERAMRIKNHFDSMHKKDGIDVGEGTPKPGGGDIQSLPLNQQEGKTNSVAEPGPKLVAQSTSYLDKVRATVDSAVKEGRMDVAESDKATSAMSGLKDLIAKGGGDIRQLPPEMKKRADGYLETLAKLPIKKRTTTEDAKATGYHGSSIYFGGGAWR